MLISHTLLYILARIGAGVISIATTAMLTRLLDPTRYGIYGVILTVMTFGSAVMFDWLGITVIRFVQSRRDDPSVRATVVTMFLGLLFLTTAIGAVTGGLGLVPLRQTGLIAAGVFVIGSYAWCEVAAQYEVANLRAVHYLRLYSTRSILTFIGCISAAWLTHDPLIVALASGVAMLLATLLGTLIRVRLSVRLFDRALARQMIMFGVPLAVSLSIGSLNLAGSRFILASVGSIDALGYYTAGASLVMVTMGVITGGLESATYSHAVKVMETGDHAETQKQLAQNFTLILAVLAPTALGMILTAKAIAHSLVGHQFSAAVAILIPVMAAGSLLGGIRSSYLDKAFQLGNKPVTLVGVTFVAALISIGGSWLLVPHYGPLGAAGAVAIAQIISCFQCRWAGRTAYPLPLPIDAIWRVGLACAIMTLVVLTIPGSGGLTLAAKMALGSISYCGAAIGFNLLGLRTKILARSRRPASS